MVVLKREDNKIGAEIKGKLNAPSAYGTRNYGAFDYGAGAEELGIYQVRTRFGKRVQVKMKYYHPSNPQTELQQAWRAIFNDGVIAWQALTDEQKAVYNKRAEGKNMSGFNLFQTEYLLSH